MTREDAIQALKSLRDIRLQGVEWTESLDIAIEALQDRSTGKWVEKNSHTYICSDCGFEQAIYGNINEYNYCPRCGVYKEYVDYGGIFPQKRIPHKGGVTE